MASRLVVEIVGGEYLNMGLKRIITKKLNTFSINLLPEDVIIDFSTDGSKADKGAQQFWPHQIRISNIGYKRPMFQGKHRPTNAFDFYE